MATEKQSIVPLKKVVTGKPILLKDGEQEVSKFLNIYNDHIRPTCKTKDRDSKDFLHDSSISFVFKLETLENLLEKFTDATNASNLKAAINAITNINAIRVYLGSRLPTAGIKTGPTVLIVPCLIEEDASGAMKINNITYGSGSNKYIGVEYPFGIKKKDPSTNDVDLVND